MRSDRIQSEFKSPVAYHARVAQRQRPIAQNDLQCVFKSRHGYHFTRG